MCSASATAKQDQSEAKIDAAPFLWCVGRLIHRYFFLKRLSAEISEKLVWNVNELDGARAKHPPNANDTCGLGRRSGDAIRFDRNE
jgi:hypothetical protein